MRKLVSLSRRTAITAAVALAAATAAVVALSVSSASAAPGAARQTTTVSCSLATLQGTYMFAGDGWNIQAGTSTPLALAGYNHFDGAGHIHGIITTSVGGFTNRDAAFSGTYTVAADCTGTMTIISPVHVPVYFDIFAAPTGDSFTQVQTGEAGATDQDIDATTEQRATRD